MQNSLCITTFLTTITADAPGHLPDVILSETSAERSEGPQAEMRKLGDSSPTAQNDKCRVRVPVGPGRLGSRRRGTPTNVVRGFSLGQHEPEGSCYKILGKWSRQVSSPLMGEDDGEGELNKAHLKSKMRCN